LGEEVGPWREFWEKGRVKGWNFGEIRKSCSRIEDITGANAEEFRGRYGGHIYFSDLLFLVLCFYMSWGSEKLWKLY
jgi:hypothetical protein